MGSRSTEIDGQPTADSTPEDVAVLYSWANLQGAKYRDYSASRREYRAQVRYRAAKTLLERELKAQEEAEAAAAEAERRALAEEATAHIHESPVQRIQLLRSAEAAARRAVAERVEAARRAEAAAHAAVLALREEREITDAHSSAKRKEQLYEESDLRRRELAGPQPRLPLGDAYPEPPVEPAITEPDTLRQFLKSRLPELTESQATAPFSASYPAWEASLPAPRSTEDSAEPAPATPSSPVARRPVADSAEAGNELESTGPAWLYASQTPPQGRMVQTTPQVYKPEISGGDTLQDSRERVAARWFALKGVFEGSGHELPSMQPFWPADASTRLLAVFSLAGGVGKTSLVATLGRAFSLQGEKVVLADTTSHALLPIYFGAREVRPGLLWPVTSAGSSAASISLAIYDASGRADDEQRQQALAEAILRGAQGNQRLVLDLASGASWLVRRMVELHPTVLVPMAPDMNSVISLPAIERLFRGMVDSNGRPVLPFYVLNQFDATLPLHLDVREVLRRQLGDRLLRVAIRRSPAVSEALAEGMTVVDYVPDAPIAQDYLDVAAWLRSFSPPAVMESSGALRGQK